MIRPGRTLPHLMLLALPMPLLAQIPCPVMLTEGSLGHDTVMVSFRNSGKLPIQQLSLQCKPAPYHQSSLSACHVEKGVFYPGMQYSLQIAYPNASARPVTINVREAELSSGARWDQLSTNRCRPLRISRKAAPAGR